MTRMVVMEMPEQEVGAEAGVPVEVGVVQVAEREVSAVVSAEVAELELVVAGLVVAAALAVGLRVAVGRDATVL
jgi:hypothetical protein